MSRSLVITSIAILLAMVMGVVLAGTKAMPTPNMVPQLHRDIYTGYTDKRAPEASSIPPNFNWCATPTGCSSSLPSIGTKDLTFHGLSSTILMLNDRLRLHSSTLGIPDIQLSRQDYLDHAGHDNLGIDTETAHISSIDVLEYIKRHGIPDETCNPYTGDFESHSTPAAASTTGNDSVERCYHCARIHQDTEPHCWVVNDYIKYYVESYGIIQGEDAMQSEILYGGPIQCNMAMDDEFVLNYRGGVYNDHGRLKKQQMHTSVEIVGWGETTVPTNNAGQISSQTKSFWIVRSTTGGTNTIGIHGFFLVERGVNAMRIEEQCIFARLNIHELESHLQGQTIGSLFGLIPPPSPSSQAAAAAGAGGEVDDSEKDNYQYYPKDWDQLPHTFKDPKEVKMAIKAGKQQDKWIYKNVPGMMKPSKFVRKTSEDNDGNMNNPRQMIANAALITDSLSGNNNAAAVPATTTTQGGFLPKLTPSQQSPQENASHKHKNGDHPAHPHAPHDDDDNDDDDNDDDDSAYTTTTSNNSHNTLPGDKHKPSSPRRNNNNQHQYKEARLFPKFRLGKLIKYLFMLAFIVFAIAFAFAVYIWYTRNTIPSDYVPIPTLAPGDEDV